MTELSAFLLEEVAEAPSAFLLNRDPAPGDDGVPLNARIRLDVLENAPARVWLDGVLVYDGPPGHLEITPGAPLASLAHVEVRVAAGAHDETYAFTMEDRTAPVPVAAVATGPRAVRVAFDEPVTIALPSAMRLEPLDVPAVTPRVVAATGDELALDMPMTPNVPYRLHIGGVVDAAGNAGVGAVDFVGFRPPRPPARRFDLWSMLPKHNRRQDDTGDLRRFIACLQEVTDLLLSDIDRLGDLVDLERAPEPFVDRMLVDLGNPFAFPMTELEKRRLVALLVPMYRQKGTAVGIRNVLRFFLGIEVAAITPIAATALVLGESELGVDWVLGPSDRFARYAFDIRVSRALSDSERRALRAIVDAIRPAHTHFIALLEPESSVVLDVWTLGQSELGMTTTLG